MGIHSYGMQWPDGTDAAQIEKWCIVKGEDWIKSQGRTLFFHFHNLMRLYWPEDDDQRWEREILRVIVENRFSAIMGCAASGKTTTASKFALCFYSCFPNDTTILISSTDMRGLEMRVFGKIKELLVRAQNKFDWFPGHVIDSKKAIATTDIDEDEVRSLKNGMICIPCLSSSGQWVGLSKFIGIHNKHVILISDEFQLMKTSILDSIPNLINNTYTKFVFLGNPLAQGDPLDFVTEPKAGWGSVGVPEKTTTWTTRYMNGTCLNLPGKDSPNFDYGTTTTRFPYLNNVQTMRDIAQSYGEDSSRYVSQCLGVRVAGLTARKIITREICDKFVAFEEVVWKGDSEIVRIYACDAAYGNIGGDLCIAGYVEFGTDINNKKVIRISPPKVVPVSALLSTPPDDQIALWIKQECDTLNIPPENVFFDGRTMLMSAFARIWSDKVNPVDFGGKPTERPVSLDMFIHEEETGTRRLKRCNEHYSKFVTELWFSLRYAIESSQVRGMTNELLEDAMPREWLTVRGNLIEAEPKHEMKLRTGKSPDKADWLVTAIEGCRRRGFQISKLSLGNDGKPRNPSPLELHAKSYRELIKSKELQNF